MTKKNRAYSSMLFAFLFFAAGLCFAYVKAESVFVLPQESNHPSCITLDKINFLAAEDIGTRELTGGRDTSSATLQVLKAEQKCSGEPWSIPLQDIVSHSKTSFYFQTVCVNPDVPTCGYEHVMQEYIHQVDGKI